MTELRKTYVADETSGNTADVEQITNDDHDIDGLYALLQAAALYARIDVDTVKPARMDASTHTLQIIGYEHHEIHGGSHYFVSNVVDLGVGDYFDLQITTPNTTAWAHFYFTIEVEAETEWVFYENVTINTAGTSVTPVNNNRNSANSSALTVATITNADEADANADTAVASATRLGRGFVGAGRNSGADNQNREIVLKQNEDYSLRIIATAAGFVDYTLEWYEHVNKD